MVSIGPPERQARAVRVGEIGFAVIPEQRGGFEDDAEGLEMAGEGEEGEEGKGAKGLERGDAVQERGDSSAKLEGGSDSGLAVGEEG